MSDGLWKDTRLAGRCLTCWSDIRDYYHAKLPKLGKPQGEDEKPRWLFRGDSPCRLRTQRVQIPCPLREPGATNLCRFAEQEPGPLEPYNYDVLKDAFKSHLDRAFEEFGIDKCWDKHKIEWGLMRTFARKAHLHTGRRDDDWLERLGLMAHYEAPHRMLDWNYSFFNALFFAVNSEFNKGDCIVWALDKAWLAEQAKGLEETILEEMKGTIGLPKASRMRRYRDCRSHRFEAGIIHYLMLTNRMACVYPVTPYYQNERLSTQQGTLICPGTINHTWGENLRMVLSKSPGQRPLVKIPICLTTEKRKEVLRELHSMNISRATLFPDLDGFARSLRTRLADPNPIQHEVPPPGCMEV